MNTCSVALLIAAAILLAPATAAAQSAADSLANGRAAIAERDFPSARTHLDLAVAGSAAGSNIHREARALRAFVRLFQLSSDPAAMEVMAGVGADHVGTGPAGLPEFVWRHETRWAYTTVGTRDGVDALCLQDGFDGGPDSIFAVRAPEAGTLAFYWSLDVMPGQGATLMFSVNGDPAAVLPTTTAWSRVELEVPANARLEWELFGLGRACLDQVEWTGASGLISRAPAVARMDVADALDCTALPWPASKANWDIIDPAIAPGFRTGEVVAWLEDHALAELRLAHADAKAAAAAGAGADAFVMVLTAAMTGSEEVSVDRGDLLLVEVGLGGIIGLLDTLCLVDFDLELLPWWNSEAENQATVLAAVPNLLGRAATASPARAAGARAALQEAIDRYPAASDWIRNRAGDAGFFILEPEARPDEEEFRDLLAELAPVLTSTIEIDGTAVSLQPIYEDPDWALRPLLPTYMGDNILAGTIPDPTFGGIIPDATAADIEAFLRDDGSLLELWRRPRAIDLWGSADALEPGHAVHIHRILDDSQTLIVSARGDDFFPATGAAINQVGTLHIPTGARSTIQPASGPVEMGMAFQDCDPTGRHVLVTSMDVMLAPDRGQARGSTGTALAPWPAGAERTLVLGTNHWASHLHLVLFARGSWPGLLQFDVQGPAGQHAHIAIQINESMFLNGAVHTATISLGDTMPVAGTWTFVRTADNAGDDLQVSAIQLTTASGVSHLYHLDRADGAIRPLTVTASGQPAETHQRFAPAFLSADAQSAVFRAPAGCGLFTDGRNTDGLLRCNLTTGALETLPIPENEEVRPEISASADLQRIFLQTQRFEPGPNSWFFTLSVIEPDAPHLNRIVGGPHQHGWTPHLGLSGDGRHAFVGSWINPFNSGDDRDDPGGVFRLDLDTHDVREMPRPSTNDFEYPWRAQFLDSPAMAGISHDGGQVVVRLTRAFAEPAPMESVAEAGESGSPNDLIFLWKPEDEMTTYIKPPRWGAGAWEPVPDSHLYGRKPEALGRTTIDPSGTWVGFDFWRDGHRHGGLLDLSQQGPTVRLGQTALVLEPGVTLLVAEVILDPADLPPDAVVTVQAGLGPNGQNRAQTVVLTPGNPVREVRWPVRGLPPPDNTPRPPHAPALWTVQLHDVTGASLMRPDRMEVIRMRFPVPPAFETWRGLQFTVAGLRSTERSGLFADPDRDGVPNIIEFLLGTQPRQRDRADAAAFEVVHRRIDPDSGETHLAVRIPADLDGLSIAVAAADQPGGPWFTNPESPLSGPVTEEVARENDGLGRTWIWVRDRTPLSAAPNRFLRIIIGWGW